MVPELLLPPWAAGGGRDEEEEGQGLTAIAGALMDRDGIQRDVQVFKRSPSLLMLNSHLSPKKKKKRLPSELLPSPRVPSAPLCLR